MGVLYEQSIDMRAIADTPETQRPLALAMYTVSPFTLPLLAMMIWLPAEPSGQFLDTQLVKVVPMMGTAGSHRRSIWTLALLKAICVVQVDSHRQRGAAGLYTPTPKLLKVEGGMVRL